MILKWLQYTNKDTDQKQPGSIGTVALFRSPYPLMGFEVVWSWINHLSSMRIFFMHKHLSQKWPRYMQIHLKMHEAYEFLQTKLGILGLYRWITIPFISRLLPFLRGGQLYETPYETDGGSSPVHLKGLWRRRPRQLHAICSLDHELMDLLKAGAPGRFGPKPTSCGWFS
jgi:hypothetical protein